MSPSLSAGRPNRLSAWILAGLVPVVLACSGLPVPDALKGGATEEPEVVAPDPVAEEPPPEPAEPAPTTPDSLFPALDPNEAPPFERAAVKCPTGTMTIRHPAGIKLSVYCATGSGVRSGPYTEWQRNALLVAGTNVDGKLDGIWTRWDKGEGDATKKVEHRVYVAGVEEGDHAEWDTKGRLLVRGRMLKGKRDGRFLLRKVENDAVVPGGGCFEAGKELWHTADEAELVKKACGSDAVAEG